MSRNISRHNTNINLSCKPGAVSTTHLHLATIEMSQSRQIQGLPCRSHSVPELLLYREAPAPVYPLLLLQLNVFVLFGEAGPDNIVISISNQFLFNSESVSPPTPLPLPLSNQPQHKTNWKEPRANQGRISPSILPEKIGKKNPAKYLIKYDRTLVNAERGRERRGLGEVVTSVLRELDRLSSLSQTSRSCFSGGTTSSPSPAAGAAGGRPGPPAPGQRLGSGSQH